MWPPSHAPATPAANVETSPTAAIQCSGFHDVQKCPPGTPRLLHAMRQQTQGGLLGVEDDRIGSAQHRLPFLQFPLWTGVPLPPLEIEIAAGSVEQADRT